jgi:hypothetical protein
MSRTFFISVLFTTSFCFFAIFTPMGNLPSDTEYSIATADAIVTHHTLTLTPEPRLHDLKTGLNGDHYSKYGVGYALLFTPEIVAADLLGKIAPKYKLYIGQAIQSFTNTLFASLIIVTFFLIFTTLRYSIKLSLIAVAMIAAASLLLPYSKIIHAEIPTTFLLLLFFLIAAKQQPIDLLIGAALGCIASALVFIKAGNAIYSIVIVCYALWNFGVKKRGNVSGVAALTCIGVLSLGLLLVLNFARFGSPFNSGYGGEQYLFNTPLFTGLTGLFFSPSKSLILFSPLVILCLMALPSFYKKNPVIAVSLCGMVIANLLFYAKWHDWHGGWCWGPRLIVPAILILHIVLPEFLSLPGSGMILNVRRSFAALLITFGIIINLLGALVWYQQICHFQRDNSSIEYSHPVIAAKLFLNKAIDRPEVYACRDFGIDCSGNTYAQTYKVTVRNDSIDFKDFEKFQGFATMWDGVRRNFHVRFLWIAPVFLLTISALGFYWLWTRDKSIG